MRQQKNMFQMKEKYKTPEEGLSEVEVGSLSEKELRVVIKKMIQELGKIMEIQTEMKQTLFIKELEDLKNKRDEQYNN